jgi:predicted flap endonuclease-1-like 5' DNA nuclease
MRSEYLFYMLAAVFFIISAVSLALVIDQMQKSLWVVTTVVLGLFSVGLGYYQKRKPMAEARQPAPATVPTTIEPGDAHIREGHLAESVEKHAEPSTMPVSPSPIPMQVIVPIPTMTPSSEVSTPLESELIVIKGIGEKRAAQLKALGINSIDDLARVSAEDLAKDLLISPKITSKWVAGAKELQK